ncbi:MAG: ABC transporter permease [Pseudohongiellaceae bacterium]
MKMIALIASREYLENVRTKGFWVTILIFPVIFIGIYFLQSVLSEATPTRLYLLIDQSGKYEQAVDIAIERNHQRRVLQNFVQYLLDNRKEANLELTAANATSAADQFVDDVDANEVAALDDWLSNGGLDFALAMATPYLKEDAPAFVPPENQFRLANLPSEVNVDASSSEIIETLRPYLTGQSMISDGTIEAPLFALIFIPENIDQFVSRPGTTPQPPNPNAGVQYWASNLTDSRLPDAIASSINSEIRQAEYDRLGVNSEQVRTVQRTRLPFSQLDPSAAQGEEAVSMADTFRQFAPIGFVYLMFVSLMQNVQYLLSNTIEEKSNRIIEVLLASVTAGELMMGKLVGIGLAGLTTIAVWLLSFFAFITLYESSDTALISQILDVILGSDLIPWFVFYYFAGYALYSGVFLAIGSLCNTLKEAQAMMTPMIMIQVIPLATMFFIVLDPNNTLVRIMSWFPLFTPYVMMNRAAANPPMIDLVGTTLLLVASIALVLWMSGKIFRHGVLRTGQPPKFVELLRLFKNN